MAKDKLLHNMVQSIDWEQFKPQHLPYEAIEIHWTNQQLIQTKICSNLQKKTYKKRAYKNNTQLLDQEEGILWNSYLSDEYIGYSECL
jgi:hypothetical protein